MTERVRVAAVIGSLNKEYGGAQQLLYDVFTNLPDDIVPSVYHLFGPATFRRDFEQAGVAVHHLRAGSKFDLMAFVRLVRRLRRDRPDVLHTNTTVGGPWGRLTAALAGVPRVISVEHSVHHAYGTIPKLVNGLTLPLADAVVGVSQSVVESLTDWERFLLGSRTEVLTIRNGIDTERFTPDPAGKSALSGGPVVGTVGRLTEAKGYEYALRAWPRVVRHVPDARLRIIGDGPRRARLERLSSRLGVSASVTFTGYRPDPLPEYRRFDVGVFPSLWEGLPLSVAQAMATGVPVVTSDIPSVRAVVGGAGVSVPPRDEEALARAVVDLLTDSERRSELAVAGRQRICRRFSIEETARRYAELYHRLSSTDESTSRPGARSPG